MPRTAIITALALLFSTTAFAGECGSRIKAFSTYEDYDDQMNKEIGVSIFAVTEYSPASSFEGLLIGRKEDKNSKVEVEVRKSAKGAAERKNDFSFQKWEIDKPYLVAGGLVPEDHIGFEEGFFVLRLTLNGKVLCEDSPREIFGTH
jgi:hypothetical protein